MDCLLFLAPGIVVLDESAIRMPSETLLVSRWDSS